MLLKIVVCLLFLYQTVNAAAPYVTEEEKEYLKSFQANKLRSLEANLRREEVQETQVVPLPKLSALQKYSLSGFSAGGFMAIQYHVAHSDDVIGMAAIAAGPYYCAQGQYSLVQSACWGNVTAGVLFNMTRSIQETNNLAQNGNIDPTGNLQSEVVWLFAGGNDKIVNSTMSSKTESYYQHYGVSNIARINNNDAGHGFITEDYDDASVCPSNFWRYINDCDYNAAEAILTSIYGSLNPATTAVNSSFIEFDQTPYAALGLGSAGYAYIPNACRSQSCSIHMFLHGCRQYVEFIDPDSGLEFGMGLVKDSGFNEIAEANNLIVLYPQALNVTLSKANSYGYSGGCFDYWGYTGSDYVTKQAAQINSFHSMIQQLQSSGTSSAFRVEYNWLPHLMLITVILMSLY